MRRNNKGYDQLPLANDGTGRESEKIQYPFPVDQRDSSKE